MDTINVSSPNDGLGDKLRDAMVKVNSNFDELLDTIDNLDFSISAIDGLSDALNDITTSISGLQTLIDNLDTRIDDNDSDIDDINSDIASINSSISTINAAIASINATVSSINDSIEENLVPYDGATSDVNLGNHTLTTENGSDLSYISPDIIEVYESSGDKSATLYQGGTDGSIKVGVNRKRYRLQADLGLGIGTNGDNTAPFAWLKSDNITTSETFQFPDKSGAGGTLATLDDSLVKETYYDSNIGTRLTPVSSSINGFGVSQSVNGQVGLIVRNTDGSGNSAVSIIGVGGTGSAYENGCSFAYYGAGYFIPSLRKTGGIYSTQDFNFINVNSSKIDFKTGTTISDATSKFAISGGGTVSIGVTPSTDNTVTKGLARKSNGDLVEFTIPTGGTSSIAATPSLLQVTSVGATTSTYVQLNGGLGVNSDSPYGGFSISKGISTSSPDSFIFYSDGLNGFNSLEINDNGVAFRDVTGLGEIRMNLKNSKFSIEDSSSNKKFAVSLGGTVSIGVTPSTDNTVTKGLARKSTGDLVEFTRPGGGGATPSLQAVTNAGATTSNLVNLNGGIQSTFDNGVFSLSDAGDYPTLNFTTTDSVSELGTYLLLIDPGQESVVIGATNGSDSTYIVTNNGSVSSIVNSGTYSNNFIVQATATSTDRRINYSFDISSTYTDRSLIDKGYLNTRLGTSSNINLQAVTNVGATSSNTITVGGLKLFDSGYGGIYNGSQLGVDSGELFFKADGSNVLTITSGTLTSINSSGFTGIFNYEGLTSNRLYTIPNNSGAIGVVIAAAPASASATGVVGEIRVTSTYIYTCIATNTWVRAAVATW